MNLTDLSEVLRDRAALPDSSHEARMAGVRARVSATRRRRAVAGVACVVLALVGIVYAVLPRPDRSEPALPPRSLPEYQKGTRLVTQAWADLPSTSVTVRFVPKSLDFWLFTHCDIGANKRLLMSIKVNDGQYVDHNTCGGPTRTPDWSKLGVVPGEETVVALAVIGEQGHQDGPVAATPLALPLPARGEFALGVGEAVPVSEYPFPPRPRTLPEIKSSLPFPMLDLRADPADPTARKEITVEWPGTGRLLAQLNTPGRVQVLVDGVPVIDLSNWSYIELSEQNDWPDKGKTIPKGQSVRITVVPERTTGDWRVQLEPR